MPLPDIDTINTFGGPLVNASPVEDPTTDRDAGQMNMALADVSAMSQTAARAIAIITTASTAAGMTLVGFWANWSAVQTNAAPTLGRISAGYYTLTLPPTVVDELGNSHNVSIRCVTASFEGATPYEVGAYPTNRYGNQVSFSLANSTNANPTDGPCTVVLVIY